MADKFGFEPLSGKKRVLSHFLCEEMLYDYITGGLDESRAKSVEEYLSKSEELQKVKKDLEEALVYSQQLSETKVTEMLLEKMLNSRTLWMRFLDAISWKKWPEFTRWTVEAFIVSFAVAIFVAISWPYISDFLPERNRDIELAQVNKALVPPPKKIKITRTDPPSQIEKVLESPKESPKKPSEKVPAKVAVVNPAEPKEKPETSKDSSKVAQGKKNTRPSVVIEKAQPKGFLYRANMELKNIESVTEEIREGLLALGGEKAGKVRMGWRKPNGSYFHFSIPEANYQEATSLLRKYGSIRITKDRHWRVMPENKIRIILWIEDLDLKTQKLGTSPEAEKISKPDKNLNSNSETDSVAVPVESSSEKPVTPNNEEEAVETIDVIESDEPGGSIDGIKPEQKSDANE